MTNPFPFMIGLKANCTGENTLLVCKSVQEQAARELRSSWCDPPTDILLNRRSVKLLSPCVSLDPLTSVCSDLTREVSFVVGGGQHKRLQLIKAQRINVNGVLSHKRDPCIITLSHQA